MFRKMRRFKQLLGEDETIHILETCNTGILGVQGDDGYPYTVPVNYYYSDNKIYIHGAKDGYKNEAVKKCDKASFCVVYRDDVCPEKHTTLFKSVIAFGRVKIVENEAIKNKILENTGIKYGFSEETRNIELNKRGKFTCLLELSIEYMTGKQSSELLIEDYINKNLK